MSILGLKQEEKVDDHEQHMVMRSKVLVAFMAYAQFLFLAWNPESTSLNNTILPGNY